MDGLREAKADLQVLREQLFALFLRFSLANVDTRKQMIDAAAAALATAELLDSEQFKRPFFHAVGSAAW